MIKLSNISKTIPGSKQEPLLLFENIYLTIANGESCSIMGRSGCGKTTLLKILAGLCTDYSGTYTFRGKKVSQKPTAAAKFRKKHIGYITQEFYLIPERTVRANVLIGNEGMPSDEVDQILRKLSLFEIAERKVKVLSGGECQRVVIARALLKRPTLLLADEPTGSLDTETGHTVLEIFKQLIAEGVQCIIITHDDNVAQICQHQFVIENKRLYAK